MTEAQFNFFGEAPDRLPPPVCPEPDYPGIVRAKLGKLMARLREAERMPLTEREQREWTILVPQMSNWLPSEEAGTVRDEFEQHLARLRTAAVRS